MCFKNYYSILLIWLVCEIKFEKKKKDEKRE